MSTRPEPEPEVASLFANGLLPWDGAITPVATRPARATGVQRRYCMRDERKRGTTERRPLTLASNPAVLATGG